MTIRLRLLLKNNFASIFFLSPPYYCCFLLYESNVNRAQKEKLLPLIVVMHVNAMVDTPRHYDYVCM